MIEVFVDGKKIDYTIENDTNKVVRFVGKMVVKKNANIEIRLSKIEGIEIELVDVELGIVLHAKKN